MRHIRLHPAARAEYDAEYKYYLDHGNLGKADQFEAEIERSFDEIVAHPMRYKKVIDDFRSYGPTKKFKYRIAYHIDADSVFIIAVYYAGSADPLYWIDRFLD